jgi:pyrroline-5-carboxylate reductase
VKLALIGCGFMGEAVLKAAIARGVVAPGDVAGAEAVASRREAVAQALGIRTAAEPAAVVDGADVVLFAVKPQEFEKAAAGLKGRLSSEQTALSIMAGVRMATLQRGLQHEAIARVMPNTPGAIGEGASVWTASAAVSEAARAQVASVVETMGVAIYADDEKYLDMATALSASGPGFVYLLIEAFIDAGVHIGFRRDAAEKLALQTFAGAAKYAQARGDHVAQLRNEVTSPAGTTAAGLQVLEDAGIRGTIIAAIEAAYERARELGEA